MTRIEFLRRLGLDTARALVVTHGRAGAADALVAAARAERPDLLIVARARDAAHAAQLYRIGASDAVPETMEASLQLAEAVLVDVGDRHGPGDRLDPREARGNAGRHQGDGAPHADIRPLGRRRLTPHGAGR